MRANKTRAECDAIMGNNLNGSCVIEDLHDRKVFTPEFWSVDDDYYTQLVLYLIIFITGVPLNIWIITRIVKKTLYSQPTYMLLLNLAVCDLLVCLFPVLLNIIFEGLHSYSFGSTDYVRCQVCKIAATCIILNFQTVFNLVLISLDRFAYFKFSIRYDSMVRTRRVVVVVIIAWVASGLLGIPPLVGYGDVVFSTACGMIFLSEAHEKRSQPYIAVGFTTHTISITIVIVTNVWILYIALKQIKKQKMTKPLPKTEGNYFERRLSQYMDVETARKQVKLFQVFGGILLVHFVTLIPTVVLIGIIVVSGYVPAIFYRFVLFSIFAAAPLHPLVEAFFTPELKTMFRRWCLCWRKRRYSESSAKDDVHHGLHA